MKFLLSKTKKYIKKTLFFFLGLFSLLNRFFIIDRVIYVVHHGDLGNFYEIYNYIPGDVFITKRNYQREISVDPKKTWRLCRPWNYIPFFFKLIFYKNIILDDSTNSIHFVMFSSSQKIIQMWHACGAFKRFGIGSHHNAGKKQGKMYKKYTHILVSSKEVGSKYSESFGVSTDKIAPIGIPRTDYFFNKKKMQKDKEALLDKYPQLRNKKIILYSPTYRTEKFFSEEVFNNFYKVASALDDNIVMVYSLHPFEHDLTYPGFKQWQNLSIESTSELMVLADVLITDYSSVIFEFSLLNKPMVFFPYDLDSYTNEQRDFYYDYESFVPGEIVKSIDELAIALSNELDISKVEAFRKKFMSSCDGSSSERLKELVLSNK
jgi:CDP-ribitol ribitolphosphotransferase